MTLTVFSTTLALSLPLIAEGARSHRLVSHRVKYLGARHPVQLVPRDKETQQEYDEETTSF